MTNVQQDLLSACVIVGICVEIKDVLLKFMCYIVVNISCGRKMVYLEFFYDQQAYVVVIR